MVTESSKQMQKFDDLAHTSISLRACIYYEISIARLRERKSEGKFASTGSVLDLRPGDRWFDLRLGQYSFRGLMIVIATEFIPLSLLSIVSKWLCGKAACDLNIVNIVLHSNAAKY